MTDDIEKAKRVVESWHLGQTSASHESGAGGAGIISPGKGDHGGISYGTYQLSTTTGTLKEYLDQSSYGAQFRELTPATPAFDAKWKELAKSDPGFAKDQQSFIGKSHFDVEKQALKAQGIDLSGRGRAVQDALWSTSVQLRTLTPDIFAKGLEEKFGKGYELSKLSDKDIVEAAQDYKIKHNATLFKSSPDLQPSLLKRANAEKAELLQLASAEELLSKNGADITLPTDLSARSPSVATKPPEVSERGLHNASVSTLQIDLNHLGYTDARGKPLHIDGHFGPATKAAVEAFQHDHRLAVDGRAGPKTLEALHAQIHPRASMPEVDNPQNPDHALYEQALAGVRQLDARAGRTSDQHSANLAAALVVAAKKEGLTRIDSVVLSTDDGSHVFAVQHAPAQKYAQVPTLPALNTPIEQSSKAAAQLNQRQSEKAPMPAPTMLAPSATAPSMSL